jgi:hypothetical protein
MLLLARAGQVLLSLPFECFFSSIIDPVSLLPNPTGGGTGENVAMMSDYMDLSKCDKVSMRDCRGFTQAST